MTTPTAVPNLEGLPIWAQIAFSLAFGIMTLLIGYKGYFRRDKPSAKIEQKGEAGEPAVLTAAMIADMGAIRNLTERVTQVTTELGRLEQGISVGIVSINQTVDSIESALREQTHWSRNNYEILRELCQRLRETREALDRLPRT